MITWKRGDVDNAISENERKGYKDNDSCRNDDTPKGDDYDDDAYHFIIISNIINIIIIIITSSLSSL